jgi:hypothetical protein
MIDLKDIFEKSFDTNTKDIKLNYNDNNECLMQFIYLHGFIEFDMDKFILAYNRNQQPTKENIILFKPIYDHIIKIINIIKRQNSVLHLTDIYYDPNTYQLFLNYIFIQSIENNLITYLII